MRLVEKHSHLNGEEYLVLYRNEIYQEILKVVDAVDAEKCITKVTKEKTPTGRLVYNSSQLSKEFRRILKARNWPEVKYSYKETHYIKQGVAVEPQFGKYTFVPHDLFAKHLLFYIDGAVDVGIEILPMMAMQSRMSTEITYYEGEVYSVVMHGRNNPPVPLLILGVIP